MEWLIWVGALISAIGLAGLVLLIVRLVRAKRANLSDDELRAAVQRALPLNLGALFLSTTGLMMVVIGILLT